MPTHGARPKRSSRHSARATISIFVMSTGVIGVQLPMEKLLAGVPHGGRAIAPRWLGRRSAGDHDHRHAAQTLYPSASKSAARSLHFTGIAKGAGMIHPNMATMLSAIATDAAISQPLLQQALHLCRRPEL